MSFPPTPKNENQHIHHHDDDNDSDHDHQDSSSPQSLRLFFGSLLRLKLSSLSSLTTFLHSHFPSPLKISDISLPNGMKSDPYILYCHFSLTPPPPPALIAALRARNFQLEIAKPNWLNKISLETQIDEIKEQMKKKNKLLPIPPFVPPPEDAIFPLKIRRSRGEKRINIIPQETQRKVFQNDIEDLVHDHDDEQSLSSPLSLVSSSPSPSPSFSPLNLRYPETEIDAPPLPPSRTLSMNYLPFSEVSSALSTYSSFTSPLIFHWVNSHLPIIRDKIQKPIRDAHFSSTPSSSPSYISPQDEILRIASSMSSKMVSEGKDKGLGFSTSDEWQDGRFVDDDDHVDDEMDDKEWKMLEDHSQGKQNKNNKNSASIEIPADIDWANDEIFSLLQTHQKEKEKKNSKNSKEQNVKEKNQKMMKILVEEEEKKNQEIMNKSQSMRKKLGVPLVASTEWFMDDIEEDDNDNDIKNMNKASSSSPLISDEFEISQQFIGEKGMENVKLQRTFKGDERFNMDERFNGNSEENDNNLEDEESGKHDDSIPTSIGNKISSLEKNSYLRILDQVAPQTSSLLKPNSRVDILQKAIDSANEISMGKTKTRNGDDVDDNENENDDENAHDVSSLSLSSRIDYEERSEKERKWNEANVWREMKRFDPATHKNINVTSQGEGNKNKKSLLSAPQPGKAKGSKWGNNNVNDEDDDEDDDNNMKDDDDDDQSLTDDFNGERDDGESEREEEDSVPPVNPFSSRLRNSILSHVKFTFGSSDNDGLDIGSKSEEITTNIFMNQKNKANGSSSSLASIFSLSSSSSSSPSSFSSPPAEENLKPLKQHDSDHDDDEDTDDIMWNSLQFSRNDLKNKDISSSSPSTIPVVSNNIIPNPSQWGKGAQTEEKSKVPGKRKFSSLSTSTALLLFDPLEIAMKRNENSLIEKKNILEKEKEKQKIDSENKNKNPLTTEEKNKINGAKTKSQNENSKYPNNFPNSLRKSNSNFSSTSSASDQNIPTEKIKTTVDYSNSPITITTDSVQERRRQFSDSIKKNSRNAKRETQTNAINAKMKMNSFGNKNNKRRQK